MSTKAGLHKAFFLSAESAEHPSCSDARMQGNPSDKPEKELQSMLYSIIAGPVLSKTPQSTD